MKGVSKIVSLCIASAVICSGSVFAETFISDNENTTAVNLECQSSEINEIGQTNGVAVTRDGLLMLSPGAGADFTVSTDQQDIDIKVISPITFDFSNGVNKSNYAEFNKDSVRGEAGSRYVDGTESPAILSISDSEIELNQMRIKFNLMKSSDADSDLINILSASDEKVFQISMSKKPNSNSMYFKYWDGTRLVSKQAVVMAVGEMHEASIELDFNTGKAKFYIDGVEKISDIPISNTGNGISSMSFGANIYDLMISGGISLPDCEIAIAADNRIEVSGSGIAAIDPKLMLTFDGEQHEIDAKYCNISVEGTDIMPVDGKIAVDLDAQSQYDLTVTADCVISGELKSCEKNISVVKSTSGDEYPLSDGVAVYTPEISEDASGVTAKFKVCVKGDDDKSFIVAIVDESGNLAVDKWTVQNGETSEYELFGSEISGDARVYLIDVDSGNNLLV